MSKSDLLHLFRYRDLLTDDTLAKHREIIDQHGECWWGWWQRPGEDTRIEWWEDLKQQVHKGGPIEIGLFNSGPREQEEVLVHKATVSAIIPPSPDGPAPRVPEEERDLVPEYYRGAPFSAAWLKLTNIEERPLENFFRQYSYSVAPRVQGIDSRRLEKFVDKQVFDAEELRSMDTTIWELRRVRKQDPRHQILTASAHVTEALSAKPIGLQGNLILHLSDLHLAISGPNPSKHKWALTNEGEVTMQAQVLGALADDASKVGLVVITGDLTCEAGPDEFYEVFRFVHGLLGALRLGPEHLVMIPGNHDVKRTQQEDQVWDPTKTLEPAPPEALEAYRVNYERVFRHRPDHKLSMARRFVCPSGVSLEVGALNTSTLAQGRNWLPGMGRLADGAFGDVARRLGWSQPSLALRILALHHHVTVTEDTMPAREFSKGFGMAVDAKKTLRDAASHGVQLILHGHRHQPFLGHEFVYSELDLAESNYELGQINIVGGGSVGSVSVRDHNNYFNLFEVSPSDVKLTLYRANSGEEKRGDFKPVHHWRAAMRIADGHLVLDPWRRL
ncbi:MAG: metallophosphoesterase [Myxococcales bacterium]|nr:metallophosphoesterase [Myxococcales bacterium]